MSENQFENIKARLTSDYNDVMLALATQRDAMNTALKKQEEALESFVGKTIANLSEMSMLYNDLRTSMRQLEERVTRLESKSA